MNIGDKLINFKLQGTNGEWYSNYSLADRYALCIIFTSNTCNVTKAYWKRIFELYDRYEQDSLGVILINSNDATSDPNESLAGMRQLLSQFKHEGILYLKDEDQSVAKSFGAAKTPEVFLFNSKRELVYKGTIDDNWENETQVMMVYLEDAVEFCLDGLDIDYPEIPVVGCDIAWKK